MGQRSIGHKAPTKHLFSTLLLICTTAGFFGLSGFAHANQALPQSGLIMHLDATQGVQTRGQNVSHWWDQSGYGQDLIASGSPRLRHNELNGKPVIEFDQVADRLQQSRPSSLPTHGNDRTLLVLSAVNRANAEFGYGGTACGAAFGLRQEVEGDTALTSGCDRSAMYATGQTNPGEWNLHILMMRSGTFYHFRNGELVDGRTARFATRSGPFAIETPNLRKADKGSLKVASVLAYNWALGTQELRAAQRYLGQRWFGNNNHFKATPNVRNIRLPKPQMNLTQSVGTNKQLELSYKVSFADECGADTGWTRSNATAGTVTIRNPPRGATYGLNCWHQSASATASFTSETQPLRITWEVPTGQENSTTGYRLFLGTRSKRYKTIVQVPANPTNSHTLDLAPGKYYVAMSTVGRQGRESSLSGEIAITVN